MTRFGKSLLVLMTVTLCGAAQTRAGEQVAAIDRMAWLAGCWQHEESGRFIHEQWMAPLGKTMIGMSRTVLNGRTVAHEFMRIEDRDGKLVFTANPSAQAEASFTQSELTDGGVMFSNPGHDFPQRISYRRQADGSLLARIEGEKDGKTRGVDFPMKRLACD